jgi:hypothetical protein
MAVLQAKFQEVKTQLTKHNISQAITLSAIQMGSGR